jgi:hypothetical protein
MTTAYKLLRKRRDGSLGPLFINRKQVVQPGVWLEAEAHPTKGFAFRPGWHCAPQPVAPHLSTKGRVWCEVLIDNFTELVRPHIQGGSWLLAKRMQLVREVSH